MATYLKGEADLTIAYIAGRYQIAPKLHLPQLTIVCVPRILHNYIWQGGRFR